MNTPKPYHTPTVYTTIFPSVLLLQTLSSDEIKPGTGEVPTEADIKNREAPFDDNLWADSLW
jgi:hypothetical protein